ncbi:unnamed protein product [Strongylus vulgaris]|uniref:Uncharacterized protein n=1 Tax=Strongylus vulgaris TaxID=40348 RepID=A0A3P7IJH2_STRVU|nr:unnamed protein product [Strongylus vulgaris]
MPGKLGREKGQHLRPFLLTVLANTLFAQEKVEFEEKIQASDNSSLSSMSMAADYCHTFYNPLFGNNCQGCRVAEENNDVIQMWTRSLTDGLSLLFFTTMAGTSQLILDILASIRMLCRNTIDSLMKHLLRRMFDSILNERNFVMFLHFIQTAIFLSDGSVPSDQEKNLREELAIRRVLEFAQEEVI